MDWESGVVCSFPNESVAKIIKKAVSENKINPSEIDAGIGQVVEPALIDQLLRAMDDSLIKVVVKGKRISLTLSGPDDPEWFHEKIFPALYSLGGRRIRAKVSWESGDSEYHFSRGKFLVISHEDSEDSSCSIVQNRINHTYGVGESAWRFNVGKASDLLKSIRVNAVGNIHLDEVYAAFKLAEAKGEYLYQGEDPESGIWTCISIRTEDVSVNRSVSLKAPGYPVTRRSEVFDISLEDVISYMDDSGFYTRKEHTEKCYDPEIYRWQWRYKDFDCCVSWRPGELDKQYGLSRFLSFNANWAKGKPEDTRTREEKVRDILKKIKNMADTTREFPNGT